MLHPTSFRVQSVGSAVCSCVCACFRARARDRVRFCVRVRVWMCGGQLMWDSGEPWRLPKEVEAEEAAFAAAGRPLTERKLRVQVSSASWLR